MKYFFVLVGMMSYATLHAQQLEMRSSDFQRPTELQVFNRGAMEMRFSQEATASSRSGELQLGSFRDFPVNAFGLGFNSKGLSSSQMQAVEITYQWLDDAGGVVASGHAHLHVSADDNPSGLYWTELIFAPEQKSYAGIVVDLNLPKGLLAEEVRISLINELKDSSFGQINTRLDPPTQSISRQAVDDDTEFRFPDFIARSDWCGDYEACHQTSTFTVLDEVRHTVLHHGATPSTYTDGAAVVRSYWNFHVNSNGWQDIGYNYLFDQDGNMYQGRYNPDISTQDVQGAHAGGVNTGSIGMCFLGNSDISLPTELQLEKYYSFLTWWYDRANVRPDEIAEVIASAGHQEAFGVLTLERLTGHRNVGTADCPGNSLLALLPTARKEVNRRLDGEDSILPQLISPSDGEQVSRLPVRFRWDEADSHANTYRLQIAERAAGWNDSTGFGSLEDNGSLIIDIVLDRPFFDWHDALSELDIPAPRNQARYFYSLQAIDDDGKASPFTWLRPFQVDFGDGFVYFLDENFDQSDANLPAEWMLDAGDSGLNWSLIPTEEKIVSSNLQVSGNDSSWVAIDHQLISPKVMIDTDEYMLSSKVFSSIISESARFSIAVIRNARPDIEEIFSTTSQDIEGGLSLSLDFSTFVGDSVRLIFRHESEEAVPSDLAIDYVRLFRPVFIPTYPIHFDVDGSNGELKAFVAGDEIFSGDEVKEGSTIDFEAIPDLAYAVNTWRRNDILLSGFQESSWTIDGLKAEEQILVSFTKLHLVSFGLEESGGTINAYLQPSNISIADGDAVRSGSEMLFVVIPSQRNTKTDWWLNGVFYEYDSDSLLLQVNQAIDVRVGFSTISSLDKKEKIDFFPNPVVNELNVLASGNAIQKIMIFTLDGKAVFSQSFDDEHEVKLNLAELKGGLYLVRVVGSAGAWSKKIIKQ